MSVQKAPRRPGRRSPGTGEIVTIVLLLLISGAPGVVAQDTPDVYGPPAPQSAGFVRILHNDSRVAEIPGFQVGPREFGPVSFGDVSPYRPVRAGIYLLRRHGAGDGAAGTELVVEPEGYTTLVLGVETVRVIRDTRHEDPTRAQLVFYNFSDTPADLSLAEGGDSVFAGVPAGESASRPVNAVTARLVARPSPPGASSSRDDAARASVQVDLKRGESFGLVLLSNGELRVHRARVRLDD